MSESPEKSAGKIPETKLNADFIGKLEATRLNSRLQEMPDISGMTLGSCHVDSRMNVVSGEADIYRCHDEAGRELILKLYRREEALKPDVVARLQEIRSPCVAPVLEFGEYQRHQYIVRPFYRYPNLAEVLRDGKRFTPEELRSLIIPSVADGLRTVHEAGILHRDLKPANMIPDDSGQHIVLIDFGISADARDRSLVFSSTGMTPCYAAPEALRGGYLRETDYYALGISLFELYTGSVPFQETANPDYRGDQGGLSLMPLLHRIEFPEGFPEDLRELVLGLTYVDLTHRNEPRNPNRRWGDQEIRKWLNHESQPVPGEQGGGFASGVFLPYRFRNQQYLTPEDLARALLKDPDAGVLELGRGILAHHFGYSSPEMAALCQKAQDRMTHDKAGNREILKRLCYELAPDLRSLFLGGREFADLSSLGEEAVRAAARTKSQEYGGSAPEVRDEDAALLNDFREFIRGDLASFFCGERSESPPANTAENPAGESGDPAPKSGLRTLLDNLRRMLAEDSLPGTDLALLFGYAVSGNRELSLGGQYYPDPQAAAAELDALRAQDPGAALKRIGELRDELQFYEKAFPDPESRALISGMLADVRRAVFRSRQEKGSGAVSSGRDPEYQCGSPEELLELIRTAPASERPYIVRRLSQGYAAALRDVSEKVWKSDVFEKVREMTQEIISVGEYLFSSHEEFQEFARDLIRQREQNPRYLRDFVRTHREALSSLGAREDLKEGATLARELITAADRVITLDYYAFPSLDGLAAFLQELRERETRRPGLMRDFARAHRSSLEDLASIPGISALVRELLKAADTILPEGEIMLNGVRYPYMSPGDIVPLGTFRFSHDKPAASLEWLVIRRSGDQALLLSRYGIDARPFHGTHQDIVWEMCDLRAWLNGEFWERAFSEKEKKLIMVTRLETPGSAAQGTTGGDVTADRIFCLSAAEVKEWLRNKAWRICEPTPYARSRGCRAGLNGASFWWLRNPGGLQNKAAGVGETGALSSGGNYADYAGAVVRPAMRITVPEQ